MQNQIVMIVIRGITGLLVGVGLWLILANMFRMPYSSTVRAVTNMTRTKKEGQVSRFDVFCERVATRISGIIRMNQFKREAMLVNLRSAGMQITPEMHIANAIVKALIVAVFAIPAYFVSPFFALIVLALAALIYVKHVTSVKERVQAKREAIEYELPMFVARIDSCTRIRKSRDVLDILESYRDTAGPELREELSITIADWQTGSQETALIRLDGRVGSNMLSEVVQGLLSILEGNDAPGYWQNLEAEFSDTQRQRLKREALKMPRRIQRLSMVLLTCMILLYFVVIIGEIGVSIGQVGSL